MNVLYWLFGLLAFALTSYFTVDYFQSGVPRVLRGLRNAIAEMAREHERGRKLVSGSEQVLDAASRGFLNAQRQARLGAFPVEALKEHGAAGARLSVLQDAGLKTLAGLHGISSSRLATLHGIGPTSARRIATAAQNAAAMVLSRPPELPGPDLAEPLAPELGSAALANLTVQAELCPPLSELEGPLRAVAADFSDLRRTGSFLSWVLAPSRIALAPQVASRGRALRASVDAVSFSDTYERLRAARNRITSISKSPAEALHQRFRENYAALAAIIEASFSRVEAQPGQSRRGRGRLPEEIALAVESSALDTQLLRLTLRRYQEFGAKYLLVQGRTILGDEMGLGKTIEALAAMCHLQSTGAGRRFLVVAPAGTLWNWEKEVSRHSNLPVHVLHPSLSGDSHASWLRLGGVAVTSYDLLGRLAGTPAIGALGAQTDLLVADEAHYAKNPGARRSKAVSEIAAIVPRVCLMSGTPLENRLEEFFRLARIARPDAADLRNQLVSPATFHERMAKLYLRRNQKDVLTELPELIEVDGWVDLSRSDANSYVQAVREGNFMAMRQRATLGDGNSDSAKFLYLREILEDHRESHRKVLVFSFFLDVLSAVGDRFEVFGRIDGSVSPAERQRVIDAFQSAPGHQILVSQIVSGGHGVNLQAASAVVIMEPQLKPSTEQQAIARAHRMGQTERVIVHRLLARNSVDERLVEILARKKRVFDEFARDSRIKDASDQAKDTQLATGLGTEIVEMERRRLGMA